MRSQDPCGTTDLKPVLLRKYVFPEPLYQSSRWYTVWVLGSISFISLLPTVPVDLVSRFRSVRSVPSNRALVETPETSPTIGAFVSFCRGSGKM